MEVILLERVEKLGQMGEVVNVKPGFARNYLLPQKKALRATPENQKNFESRRGELETANAERRTEAEKVADNIANSSVILVRQASEAGQLYGSVRPIDIANALNEQGARIDRTKVKLTEPIKLVGMHTVRIAVHPEVVVEITANVARSEGEATLQAQGKSLIDEEAEDSTAGYEKIIDNEDEYSESKAEADGEDTTSHSEDENSTPQQESQVS